MDRLDGMRLFARVVETGSFSEGARQEGIGQATVSKITTLPRSLTLVSTMTRSRTVIAGSESARGDVPLFGYTDVAALAATQYQGDRSAAVEALVRSGPNVRCATHTSLSRQPGSRVAGRRQGLWRRLVLLSILERGVLKERRSR